jgi:chromosome segregation ATPase
LAATGEVFDRAISENQDLSSLFNSFLLEISVVGTGNPVRLSNVLTTDAGNDLIDQIGKLRSTVTDLRCERDSQAQLLNLFSRTFQGVYGGESEIAAQITKAGRAFDELKGKSFESHRKVCKLQLKVATPRGENEDKSATLENKIATLQAKLDDAEELLKQREREITVKDRQIESLHQEIVNTNGDAEASRSHLSKQHQGEIEALRLSKSQVEEHLTAQVEQWAAQFEQLRRAKEDDERQIAALRKTLQALQAAKERQEKEAEQFQVAISERQKLPATRSEDEKHAVVEAQQSTILELRRQLADARKDIERLSTTRDEFEHGLKHVSAGGAHLEKEKRTLMDELYGLKAQLELEKRIADLSVQAAKLSAESAYHQKLDEERAKADSEKRSLCATVFETFREFFNPTDAVHDTTLRNVLEAANEELSRLAASDSAIRKMLVIGPSQTTDDAVAQLLLKKRD